MVDEYGALQGLVTLEDILEEIVGEIDDEHDEAVQGVRRQADGSVHVDGDVSVRDLNRAMDWDLPDDHAVTIAGLVIHEARAIPEPGQTFLFHRHRFQILRRQRNQITALRVSPPPMDVRRAGARFRPNVCRSVPRARALIDERVNRPGQFLGQHGMHRRCRSTRPARRRPRCDRRR